MSTPEQILKEYWGYDGFRPLQRDIIDSVLDGRDTLALLPTGGGKSVCYQVPALMREGFCLVISPLIALMQDQVGRLKALDIPAESIHSGMHYNDVKRILSNAVHGGYKLLYVSPERLQTELFRDHLDGFDISMIAVDEAHCISQWGHDFRPNYLKIAEIRNVLDGVPVLALTATATTDVQADIVKQLALDKVALFRQSFARNNIFYDIKYSENKNGDTVKHSGKGCGIVYCRSRKQTEAVSKYLLQAGIGSTAYHAGMSKEKRDEAQEKWMSNAVPVIVATTAFGMGIDKPDVRSVLHYDAPEHPEAYYQEAGRAGRDGQPSVALGLYNSSDIKRLVDSVALQYPPEAYLRQVYQAVVEYLQVPIGAQPDRYYHFDVFDLCQKFSLQVNSAIYALKLLEQEGLWTISEAVYSPATVQFVTPRHVLDNIGDTYPELGYVIIGLLRMYGSVFQFPTHVRETAIAQQLKMQKEEIEQVLERLQKMEIIEYNKPGNGPQLFFHHYRVDSRYLTLDLKRIEILRKRHKVRTEAMIRFLENRTICREKMLLTYFGEELNKDCGHCDVCRDRQPHKINYKELRKELTDKIAVAGNLRMEELVTAYPAAAKEQVVACMRAMLDDGILAIENGIITATGR